VLSASHGTATPSLELGAEAKSLPTLASGLSSYVSIYVIQYNRLIK
jgi:hypothetical protein